MVGSDQVVRLEDAPLLRDEEMPIYSSLADPLHEADRAFVDAEPPPLSIVRLLALNAFIFVYGALISAMGVIVLPREMQRMFEAKHAVIVVGLAGLSQLVCPLAGFLSDRCSHPWGRRRPYFLGSGLVSCLLLLLLWTLREHKYGYAYLAAFFVAMITLSVSYACFTGLVRDVVPDNQFFIASGVMAGLYMLGAGIGITGVGWVVPINLAYFIYIGCMLATLTLTSLSVREEPIEPETFEWSELVSAYAISETSHGDFFWVFCGRGLYYTAVSVQTFLLFYLRDVIHVDNAKTHTALLCLVSQFAAALFAYPMAQLSERYGRKNFVYFSCAVMAVVYLMYWMVVGLGLAYGIGNGTCVFMLSLSLTPHSYLAVDYNLANSTLPNKKEAAKDLGLWGIAACLGMMAGPLLCGPLLYYFGRTATPAHYTIQGYTVLMVLGSLVSLLSAAMVTRIKNVK